MATSSGTAEFTSARDEITGVLNDYGNTIEVTPVTVDITDTDEWGEYSSTEGTPFNTSAVTYDTEQLKKDFGQSVILSSGESMLLVKYDVTINPNDTIGIDGNEYKAISIEPLKAADVLIAQMLRVGIKQD